MHRVAGLFDGNGFRSSCVLQDLRKYLGDVSFYILWDRYDSRDLYGTARMREVYSLHKAEVLDFVSTFFKFDKTKLSDAVQRYRLLWKILLLFYLRKAQELDYCLLVDNDIFIYEQLGEIPPLSLSRIPFFVQEAGPGDRLPEISAFITNFLGREIRNAAPGKGLGYNIGFCGLDLTVLDAFGSKEFHALMETLNRSTIPWKDQALIVSLMLSGNKEVSGLQNGRYFFAEYDDPNYQNRSKIYHCIFTADKEAVDLLHLARSGGLLTRWLSRKTLAKFYAWCRSKEDRGAPAPEWLKLAARQRLKSEEYWRTCRPWKASPIEARYGISAGADVLVGTPNADRYRSILSYLRRVPCKRILEIGVWRGDTSELLIRNSRLLSVEYHGVDVFEELPPRDRDREVCPMVASPLETVRSRLERIGKRVFLHKGPSHDLFPELRSRELQFDLIWIDGGHSYETVKRDFEEYSQLLAPNGIIFFDDYTEDPYLPYVKKYVDREIKTNSEWAVTLRDDFKDHYRGFDYRVVSVQRPAVRE